MTAEATGLARPLSDRMRAAVELPDGARFYRCALQVNPFAYLETHGKATLFKSEEEYNGAIIETCLEVGIEVIAVTDHYRVKHSAGLVRAARKAHLHAFSGFEAVTKDGVHFLCLFDPDKDEVLERFHRGVRHSRHQSTVTNGQQGFHRTARVREDLGRSVHRRPRRLGRWIAEKALGAIESQYMDPFRPACLCAAGSSQRRTGRDQADPREQECPAPPRPPRCDSERFGRQRPGRPEEGRRLLFHQDVNRLD